MLSRHIPEPTFLYKSAVGIAYGSQNVGITASYSKAERDISIGISGNGLSREPEQFGDWRFCFVRIVDHER